MSEQDVRSKDFSLFKVGDKIESATTANLDRRVVSIEWASSTDGAGNQYIAGSASDGYPFARLIYLPDWTMSVGSEQVEP